MTAQEARLRALPQWSIFIKPYEKFARTFIKERVLPKITQTANLGCFNVMIPLADADFSEEMVNGWQSLSEKKEEIDGTEVNCSIRNIAMSYVALLLKNAGYEVYASSHENPQTGLESEGLIVVWGDIREFEGNSELLNKKPPTDNVLRPMSFRDKQRK